MTSLIEVEWYELWNGEERGMTWKWSFRNFFGYEGKRVHYKISLFSVFLRSISDVSVMEKSNKANGQNKLLGQCRPFREKTGGLFMYSVSRPKKDGLMLLTWFSDLWFED